MTPVGLGFGAQLRFFGIEHRHLTLCCLKRGLAVRQIGPEPLFVGDCLFDFLWGAEGVGQQCLLAHRLLAVRSTSAWVAAIESSASAIWVCCNALRVFRFSIAALAPRSSRLGLFEPGAVVVVLDLNQQIALLDLLKIIDRDGSHMAFDLGAERGDVAA